MLLQLWKNIIPYLNKKNGIYVAYRLVIEKESGAQIRKEHILDNHSLVMYDHSLIPKEQIRDD